MSEGRLYPAHPLIGVGVVILDPGGRRVLLIRRARPPGAGQWSIPGGLVELGETTQAAARREVFEETGLHLGSLRLLDTVDIIERDPDGRVRLHYALIDFAARVEKEGLAPAAAGGGEAGQEDFVVIINEEVMEARWFAPDELHSLGLWSETSRIIALAFAEA